MPFASPLTLILIASLLGLFSSCSSSPRPWGNQVIVSIKDQKMALYSQGVVKSVYPVSTSKFGISSRRGSRHTPLGQFAIARKVGGGAPSGAVFKSRRRTGEVLRPNAPGRDPIVTRILWLRGLERSNSNTFGRYIYIHGTPEERNIGRPASYGCVRMKSRDIIHLYNQLRIGSRVTIIRESLPFQ